MVTLVFKKHFTKGNLAGLTITDHLTFVNNTRAWEWIDNVLEQKGLDWNFVTVGGLFRNTFKTDELAWRLFDCTVPVEVAIEEFGKWYGRVK